MHLRSFKEGLVLISTHCNTLVNLHRWLNSLGGKTNLSSFGLVPVSNCSLGPRDHVKCRYYPLTYGFPFLKGHSSATLFSIRNDENTLVVFKASVHYFLSNFLFFHQMIALQKL